jgi:hypothetical protein
MKVFLILLLLSVPAVAQARRDLSQFSWISGCWETTAADGTTTERWGPATSDMMVGASQTVKNGKTTSYEFLRILTYEKGPSYIARPANAKEETEFKFLRSSNTEIVFENAGHDFPQRIIYKSDGPDKLTARVEGRVGGTLRGIAYQMTRVKC